LYYSYKVAILALLSQFTKINITSFSTANEVRASKTSIIVMELISLELVKMVESVVHGWRVIY